MAKKSTKSSKKKMTAHVTHLEMSHPHFKNIPVPTRPVIALIRAKNIPVNYYRYIYELVGKAFHWQERRIMKDAELFARINDEDTEINILYADGCPAGFFELDKSNVPEFVEIVYLGLGADYQGLGLGKWLLSTAISAAWAHNPGKVILQTNTLDHPAALPLYQKMGFSPVATSTEEVIPWA